MYKYIHTRLKSLFKVTNKLSLYKVLLTLLLLLTQRGVGSGPAKLLLYNGLKRMQMNAKQCNVGVYTKNPTVYSCACVTGIWGFYENYCEHPFTIAGGDNYCFRLKENPISQIVTFGNPQYPFASSLSIFHENFYSQMSFHMEDNNTHSGVNSSFLTITDTPWTIYGDKGGEGICLTSNKPGKRTFCLYGKKFHSSMKSVLKGWNYIKKVKKGCLSKKIARGDSCSEIIPPNDLTDCSLEALEDSLTVPPINEIPTTSPPYVNNTERFQFHKGWIQIQPRKTIPIKESKGEGWIQIQPRKSTTKEPNGIKIDLEDEIDAITTTTTTEEPIISSSEQWIPIRPIKYTTTTTTTTQEPSSKTEESPRETVYLDLDEQKILPKDFIEENNEDLCKNELNRDKVKNYWLDPSNNICSKSINEAVFTDQLRRFTTKHFDQIYPSRLKSLTEMEILLNYTKLIMQKTCGEEFVPTLFFEVAYDAFVMFLKEDFFYGVEGAIPDVYHRIVKTLTKCLARAKPFAFESDELECGIKKINGWVILPGKKEKLEVSDKDSFNNFEPLIETMWKMFLNTHSLCFPDFQYSNDHHHFSVLIMELFSKNIYEKWIEPLESQVLYSFILPNFNFLKQTMENIDYCVAATSKVSNCPVWLSRSGIRPLATIERKKRSIWVDKEGQDKRISEVWNGEAYCLQNMNDPEIKLNLSLPTCGP